MTAAQSRYDTALELIDAANREDPNRETVDAEDWPKELLYSHRMSDMLERYAPEADEPMRLAARAQHIQRWKTPRSTYPAGRKGYHQWRSGLYTFHADTAAALLAEAGYDEAAIERVRRAVGKRGVKTDPDAQLLEDVASLVFIEHYMLPFHERHPEYDEAKWIDIIRKTWRKMSERARAFALSGAVALPQPLVPLIQKTVAE